MEGIWNKNKYSSRKEDVWTGKMPIKGKRKDEIAVNRKNNKGEGIRNIGGCKDSDGKEHGRKRSEK